MSVVMMMLTKKKHISSISAIFSSSSSSRDEFHPHRPRHFRTNERITRRWSRRGAHICGGFLSSSLSSSSSSSRAHLARACNCREKREKELNLRYFLVFDATFFHQETKKWEKRGASLSFRSPQENTQNKTNTIQNTKEKWAFSVSDERKSRKRSCWRRRDWNDRACLGTRDCSARSVAGTEVGKRKRKRRRRTIMVARKMY